jgi:hypothetical protein
MRREPGPLGQNLVNPLLFDPFVVVPPFGYTRNLCKSGVVRGFEYLHQTPIFTPEIVLSFPLNCER